MNNNNIPLSAADRILRNPHSLPTIPDVLADPVSKFQHEERIKSRADSAHLLRQERIDNTRLERIRSQYNLDPQFARTTFSAGVDGDLAINEDGNYRYDVGLAGSPGSGSGGVRRPRSLSVGSYPSGRSIIESAGPLFYHESLGTTRRHSMVQHQSAHLPHNKLFFSPDDTDAALWTSPSASLASGRSFSLSLPWQSSPSHHHNGHSSPVHIFSSDPAKRLRQRCYYCKRPFPSMRRRSSLTQPTASISPAQSHPSWHRLMRNEYRVNGEYDTWRDERNRFLQECRRDRQFEKQAKRRRLSFS